jgi:hypothetical protein
MVLIRCNGERGSRGSKVWALAEQLVDASNNSNSAGYCKQVNGMRPMFIGNTIRFRGKRSIGIVSSSTRL